MQAQLSTANFNSTRNQTNRCTNTTTSNPAEGRQQSAMIDEIMTIFYGLSSLQRLDLLDRLKSIFAETYSSEIPANRSKLSLSRRETEVLVMLANGYNRREMGKTLHISANTASRHIANIYRKLGVSSVAAATRYALVNKITLPQCDDAGQPE